MQENVEMEIKRYQKDLRLLSNQLKSVADIKLGQKDEVGQLEKALRHPQKSQILYSSLEQLEPLTSKLKLQRARELRAQLPIFLEEIRSENKDVLVHETAKGYRVGILHLVTREDQFRFLYDECHLQEKWQHYSSPKDLCTTYKESIAMLDDFLIPKGEIGEIFFNAYNDNVESYGRGSPPKQIQINEFYKLVRVALFQNEVDKKTDFDFTKARTAKFPDFAFRYNLDTYVGIRSEIPEELRIYFDEGTQAEVHDFGMVIGGNRMKRETSYCNWVHGPSKRRS